MTFCRKYQVKKLKGEVDLSKFHDLSQVGQLDPDLLHAILEALRKWELKSGQLVAATHRDPNLKRERAENRGEFEQNAKGLKSHPYLDSPRFDGVDPNVTPNPRANDDPNVQEALRNELELRYMPTPGQTFVPPKPY